MVEIRFLDDDRRLVDGRVVSLSHAKKLCNEFKKKCLWMPKELFIDLTAGIEPKIEETDKEYVVQCGYYSQKGFTALFKLKKEVSLFGGGLEGWETSKRIKK